MSSKNTKNRKEFQDTENKEAQDTENKEPQDTENKEPQDAENKEPQDAENKEPQDAENKEPQDAENKEIKIYAKCNTGKNIYYRAGIKFLNVFREYQVTKEVLEILKKDKHLIITDTLD